MTAKFVLQVVASSPSTVLDLSGSPQPLHKYLHQKHNCSIPLRFQFSSYLFNSTFISCFHTGSIFSPHKIIIDLILCLPPTLCLSRYNIPVLCILSASVYFSLCPSVSVQSSPFCCTSDHEQCSHRPRPMSQLKPIQDKAPTIPMPDRRTKHARTYTSPPFQPPN